MTVVTNRRERAKDARRRRIAAAASALFRDQGYDATTTDQIAARADVAKGTLFLYARTKVHLLLLVYEEALERAVDDALGGLDPAAPVVDALVGVFTRFFRLYEGDVDLARRFVQSQLFMGPEEAPRLTELTRRRLLGGLTGLVRRWQADGRVAADVDPFLAAQTSFALYFAVLAGWLGGHLPSPESRDETLRRGLALHWRGLLINEEES
jgi:AcrR family transcriptional regulator